MEGLQAAIRPSTLAVHAAVSRRAGRPGGLCRASRWRGLPCARCGRVLHACPVLMLFSRLKHQPGRPDMLPSRCGLRPNPINPYTFVQVLFAQSSVLAGLKGLPSKYSCGDWEHEIRLKETAADTALLLRHMYGMMTNQPPYVRQLNYEDAARLAGIADRLCMPGVMAHIESLLLEERDYLLAFERYERKVVDWWLLADRFNFTTLRAHCEVCVAEDFRHYIGLKEVRQISGPSLARAAFLYMRQKEERTAPSVDDEHVESWFRWI